MYASLPKEKAMEVVTHWMMKKYFKETPVIFLDRFIQESVQIHDYNIDKVEK